jgi:endonuclease/exonuclease/phosphatase family metal-dependent hydrolase
MKTQQTTISEVSLIYRSKVKASDSPQVKCFRDTYNLFMEHWNHDTIEHVEEFKVMLMNRSNAVLGFLQRNLNKPYLIDYCFASSTILDKVQNVEIGTYQNWTAFSDHTPLVIDFNL